MIVKCEHIFCENAAMWKMDKLCKLLRGNRPAVRAGYGLCPFILMLDRWGYHPHGPEEINLSPVEYLVLKESGDQYYTKCNRCIYAMIINTSYHKEPNIHLLRKLLSRTIEIKESINDYPGVLEGTIQTIKEVIRVAIDGGYNGITQDQLEEFVQKTVDQAYYMGN